MSFWSKPVTINDIIDQAIRGVLPDVDVTWPVLSDAECEAAGKAWADQIKTFHMNPPCEVAPMFYTKKINESKEEPAAPLPTQAEIEEGNLRSMQCRIWKTGSVAYDMLMEHGRDSAEFKAVDAMYKRLLVRFNNEENEMDNMPSQLSTYPKTGAVASGNYTKVPPPPQQRPMLDEFHERQRDLLAQLADKVQALHNLADRYTGSIPQPNDAKCVDKPDSLLGKLHMSHTDFECTLASLQHAFERLASV